MDFSLVKADKDLFAIYQTMYSNADIEMWYDWGRRLRDTTWTDECFFLMSGGKKVGGLIITDDRIMYPFMITPFGDRTEFWSYIMKHHRRADIFGVSPEDARVLAMFDNKVTRTAQVMCRPADVCEPRLPDGFSCRALGADEDFGEVAEVMVASYSGGICYEINGAATRDDAANDVKEVLEIYSPKSFSHVITDDKSGKIVAVCLAGIGENYVHHYTEIAELCVLPEYRRMGLARYMIQNVITKAYGTSPFVKLFVYCGNSAEHLYRQEGFIAGPQFINMTKR